MCCAQVDSSSVPWDFFISSKITSDDDDDVHMSCYLYDNGCLTLWRTPNEVTVEVLTLFSVCLFLCLFLKLSDCFSLLILHTGSVC